MLMEKKKHATSSHELNPTDMPSIFTTAPSTAAMPEALDSSIRANWIQIVALLAPLESLDADSIFQIQLDDLQTLREKSLGYVDSWKKRGGVGAYMNIARKIDRIENQCKQHGYDIFKAAMADKDGTGIRDDLKDLSCYLLLFRAEIEIMQPEEKA